MSSEVHKRQRENTSGDLCITCNQDVEENGVLYMYCIVLYCILLLQTVVQIYMQLVQNYVTIQI